MLKNRWLIAAIITMIVVTWIFVAISASTPTPPGIIKGDEPQYEGVIR